MPAIIATDIESVFKDCTFGLEFWETIQFFAALVYGSMTIILYILEIRLILKTSKLRHPFYFQFIYLSIMNICLWLCMFLMSRLVRQSFICHFFYPRFNNPTHLLKPVIIVYNIAVSGQLFCVMLININRLCVIIRPFGGEKVKQIEETTAVFQFWDKFNPYALILIFLLSVLFSSHMWLWTGKVDFITYDHLTLMFVEAWPFITPSESSGSLAFLCMITILLCTGISLCSLWRHWARTREAEINLFFTSLAFSLTTGVFLCFMITMYFVYWMNYNERILDMTMDIRGYVYDINCLVPAYLLLFINSPFRRILGCWKNQPQFIVSNSRT